MKKILFSIFLLSQIPVFAYQILDQDQGPVQNAVNFCAKQMESRFPGVVLDDAKTTVATAWQDHEGAYQLAVSMPFKASGRSGIETMLVDVWEGKVQAMMVKWSVVVGRDGRKYF